MTQEEILKGNKLIADYMNVDFFVPYMWRSGVYCELTTNHLRYHISMDWLLPVINKIKKSEEFSIIAATSYDWEITIETTGYHYVTQAFQVNEDLVEGCWLACIEYIEKFNTGTLKVAKK